jgi:hypothetical protein
MSYDPLALPGFAVGLPQEVEYEAVYAAVTATERGRWFLTEYASRNRHADTDSLVAALARIEATVQDHATLPSSATLSRDLAEIAVTVERIRAAIGPERTGAPDIDAAAKLLDDLAGHVQTLLKLPSGNTLADEGQSQAITPDNDAVRTEADVASTPIEPAVTAEGAVESASGAGPDEESLVGLFDMELRDGKKFAAAASALAASFSALDEDTRAAEQTESRPAGTVIPPQDYDAASEPRRPEPAQAGPRWYIEPPDFLFDSPGKAVNGAHADVLGTRSLLPGAQLLPDPQDDPADLFDASPQTRAVPNRVPPDEASQAAQSPPTQLRTTNGLIRTANGPMLRTMPRPVPNPLAALHALSEEELIALFG